jgi:hypothetical protein
MDYSKLQSFMVENNFRPEFIAHLLKQGIEMERIQYQTEKVTHSENFETTLRILQGERFLSILSVSRFT